MTSQICSKEKMQEGQETTDEVKGSAIEDIFRKISVPGNATCLFWAVTIAYLLPVKNNESLFGERFRRLFGVKGESDVTQIRNLLLNQPLNVVYKDVILIELVVRVFRNRVADAILEHEEELSRSVTINDFLRGDNGSFITDGTFAKQFHSAFPSQIHLLDLSKLKPSQLDQSSIHLLNAELDKVSDKNQIHKFLLESYVSLMRSRESWGGGVEIAAIKTLLECKILIINSKENTPINNLNVFKICLFNFNEIYYEFGLVKAKVVIETLKREYYQLAADYIDLGLDKINYQDTNGDSPLHLAALSNNQNDLINKLIWQGADLHVTNDTNQTPLDAAIDFKLHNSIAILNLYPTRTDKSSARGLAFIEKTKISNTVTISSVKNEETRKNTADTIETQTELRVSIDNSLEDTRSKALHLAIISNNLNVVENLIENGADVNAFEDVKNSHCSPLHRAAEKGFLDIVKVLIEKGEAEVDIKDSTDETPLQKAVKLGHLKIVKYLLDKDADVNAINKTLMCALSYAAVAGHVHIVQYLIEHGADINAIDHRGMTPLHHAVECARWRVVQCLVEHKADLNIADNNNKTVLEKVLALGEWGVVRYFLEKGASLINSTEDIRKDIFKRFINDESHIENQFYQAIKLGNVEILEIVFDKCGRDKSEEVLAEKYDELRFIRFQLNQNISFFIENKLLDYRFFSHNQVTSKQSQAKTNPDLNNIKARLNFVISCIDRMNGFGSNDKVQEVFLYIGKFIAQNLQILKRQLPSTYEVLPWEEIQFCLLTFIMGYTHELERDVINELILRKPTLLSHLDLFGKTLADVEKDLKEEDTKNKKIMRGKAIENISKTNPGFKELYQDFEMLKDVYSLKRIEKHIQIACSVDLKVKPTIGQLAIERAVQVIGECLKNTLDSPNLSDNVQNMLIINAPQNVKDIIVSLRDSLSHANNALNIRAELESYDDSQFFTKMQEDLRKLETAILFILRDINTQAIIAFLEKILKCENLEEARSMSSGVHTSGKVNTIAIDPKMYSTGNLLTIRNDFTKLSDLIKIKTEFQIDTFRNIFKTIDNYKISIEGLQSEPEDELSLRDLLSLMKSSDNNFINIKNESENLLISLRTSLAYNDEHVTVYGIISNFTLRLRDSVKTANANNLNSEISDMLDELLFTLHCEVNRMKSLETFKSKFEKENYVRKKTNDEVVFNKIEKKMSLFIDEIADAETKASFTAEYIKKKEIYENKVRPLNEENKMRQLNRKTDSYEILVTKMRKEPMNVFMKNAFTEFVKSFDARKKLAPHFITNNERLFFDSEIYFGNSRTMENIVGKELSGCDVIHLLRENDDVRVAVEMLMLTLLEILDTLSLLDTNRLFLDEPSPILVGKNLRNYLAHGDLLIDILSIDHIAAIVSHFKLLKRLSEEDKSIVYAKNTLIGKPTAEDVPRLKKNYELKLELLEKQNQLFAATFSGDKTAINRLIDMGVEIKISRADGLTLFHVTAFTDNVKLFKKILNYNLNLYQKDIFGNSILSDLTEHGCKKILKFLYNRFSIDLDGKLGSKATLMHLAAKCNQIKVLKFLIANEADVNITNSEGHTPLQLATKNGHLAVIVALHEAGANLSVRNEQGFTLLHFASSAGVSPIVHYLMDKNVDIHAIDNKGRTPLHSACMYGHKNIVDILLKHNVDVNAVTISLSETPLHFATYKGDNGLIQTLLDHNADLHKVTNNGNTALHSAALHNNINAAVVLLRNGADIEAKNIKNVTPLLCASFLGHYEMIKTLLVHGANANNTVNQQTALHVAAMRNHVESVKVLLIDGNAKVNLKNHNEITVLHLAAQKGNVEIIRLLLAANSNINEVDNKGYTPLHVAVIKNRNAAVELLISKGSDIEARDEEGDTPLLIACRVGNVHIFDMLRDKNANIHVKNHDNVTPFYLALGNGHIKILEKILPFDNGKDYKSELGEELLHIAAIFGYDSIVKLLIKKEFDVNERGMSAKSTPLHLAAKMGHDTTVTQLLNLGADVNATLEPFSRTALHGAADKGHAYVAEILLQAGAHVDALDIDDETPLHTAASKGHAHLIPVLVNYKANIMAKDINAFCPIHTASFYGFHEFIMELLSYGARIEELTDSGWSVLHIAIYKGHLEVVKCLLTLDKSSVNNMINQLTFKGESPLYMAVRLGHLEVAEWLMKHGADVFIKHPNDSVLHQAVKNDKLLNLVLAKIQNKCDGNAERLSSAINAPDAKGNTPLMWAATIGNVDSTRLLLENREIDIDRQNVDGQTALHWSAGNCHAYVADETPLHSVTYKGDDRLIQTLLDHNADLHKIDNTGDTALHIAALNNNINAAVALLRNGADIEAKNNKNVTPLLRASYKGHYEMIKTLLAQGANANVTVNQLTALHIAAISNHVESVKALLIDGKAEVNIKNDEGRTALHFAAEGGNVEIIRLLLDANSNINEVDYKGHTPLHVAVFYNRNAAVELLISEGSDIEARDEGGDTPLLHACVAGNVHIFEMLRDKNANIFVKNHKNFTPFYLALVKGNIKILEKILPFDDGKECELDLGKSSLHLAAFCGYDSIVKLLIKRGGISINEPSLSDKRTPLHLAARNGHDTTVTQLINLGADVNATYEPFSETALHEAVENGHASVAEILLQSGAHVEALNINHRTPLHAAASKGHAHLIPVLVKYKANVMAKDKKTWSPIHTAAFFGFHEFIMTLLSYGVRIEELTDSGWSVLHIAIYKGHLEVVKCLLTLDKSSVINIINQLTLNGESPLYLAVRLGHLEVAEWLVKNGADVFTKHPHDSVLHQGVKNSPILNLVLAEIRNKCDRNAEWLSSAMNAPDGEGDTPLMWAAEKGNVDSTILLLKNSEIDIDRQNVDGQTALHWSARNGHINIAQLLIHVYKADDNIKDKLGRTALHWAAHNGHPDIVTLLEKAQQH